MDIKAIVCDDQPNALHMVVNAVRQAFQKCGVNAELTCCNGWRTLMKQIDPIRYDVVFLDVDMPEMDGIALGHKLRQIDNDLSIIFVSNFESRVFEAQQDALHFVRKRNLESDLQVAVQALLKNMAQKHAPKMLVTANDTERYLRIRDILYVESFGKEQKIVLPDEHITVRYSMDYFEKILLPHQFLRVHRCYIVNCRAIYSLARQEIIMDDRQRIPVGRTRLEECKRIFRKLVEDDEF